MGRPGLADERALDLLHLACADAEPDPVDIVVESGKVDIDRDAPNRYCRISSPRGYGHELFAQAYREARHVAPSGAEFSCARLAFCAPRAPR